MRCLPALLSLLLVLPVFGQQYFEGLFGGEETGNGIASGGTVLTEDGYLTLSYKLRNGVSRPFIFSIDTEGQQTDSLSFAQADTVYRMSLNLLDMGDRSYVGLSSWRNLNQESAIWGDCHLFRFDAQGQVEWESTLGDPNRREIPQRVVSTADGGFAIAGQAIQGVTPNASGDAYLIRTDALGNALWEQTYGGTLYDAASDLIQTPDGGFLLLGWTRSFGAGQRDFYLVKTDSFGGQQWQRTYGGSDMETGLCILNLSDGNYMLAGAQIIGGINKGKFIKVSGAGNVIWQKEYLYPNSSASEINKVIELNNGNLVGVGVADSPGEGNAGWLIKTDSEGAELWQRKYNKNQYTDLFYSVLLAEDGGFLLSGQAMNEETMSQDAWLLKVDSVGCPYPNCLVGIDETDPTKVMVDVWPNPVTDVLNLELQQQGGAEVHLYDMAGKLLLQKQMTQMQETVDVSTLQNGLYLLTVIQASSRTTVRIVVQH